MNPLRTVGALAAMSPSRRRQWLAFKRDRLITNMVYALRLARCGRDVIVQKPLFWTPEFVEIGNNVLIWSGCRIEGISKYAGEQFTPVIRFEDGVSLQQACHIISAGNLVIGRDTTISSSVFITDTDHSYESIGVNILQQPLLLSPTTIGRSCFIGVGARILAGTNLGDHCVVGANAVVRGTFPDNCVIGGIPARIVKRFDPDAGTWRKTDAEGQFL